MTHFEQRNPKIPDIEQETVEVTETRCALLAIPIPTPYTGPYTGHVSASRFASTFHFSPSIHNRLELILRRLWINVRNRA
jgi:hypothetical protein